MIQLSLVAIAIVLIGLQCRHLAGKSGRRPATLPPADVRTLLAEVRREHTAQQ